MVFFLIFLEHNLLLLKTHSQVAQMVASLKKTPYRPRMAILGSRERMCIHKDLRPRAKAEQKAAIARSKEDKDALLAAKQAEREAKNAEKLAKSSANKKAAAAPKAGATPYEIEYPSVTPSYTSPFPTHTPTPPHNSHTSLHPYRPLPPCTCCHRARDATQAARRR